MLFSIKRTKEQKNLFFPKIKENFIWKTPAFYTDINLINQRLDLFKKTIKKEWGNNFIIAYSLKTNYQIIDLIKKKPDFHIEVTSDQEYMMAKSSGFLDSKIIYNGPYKTNLLEAINKKNIIINIDNQSELDLLINNKTKIKSLIGIRINSRLKKSRFGFNIENGEFKKTVNLLKINKIKINGLQIHFGFYTPPKTYNQISKKIINLIKENDLKLDYLDFGGGFPSHGEKPYGYRSKPYHSIKTYIKNICLPLKKFFDQDKKPTIIFEPGRFIVDDSTIFVSKIINVKKNNKTQIVIINGTNNMLPSVWFRPQIIKTFPQHNTTRIKTIIYGSSCQEDDILYQGQLPSLKDNDFIFFYCVGAYNQNMSNNFIFPKPKSYFLNKE